ncbi:uncharacterized protein RMCB_5137 [Mycolicibacterium brisbanense]|uniref:Uncharacterized protein n=1 Tax=Mycolicibacterium brisbanense TaxID=146020 RepID=A0A100W3W1_9MYCO|nr:uncharacterized protein RMCB_5137 [Mycolicibacterium brisbanense]
MALLAAIMFVVGGCGGNGGKPTGSDTDEPAPPEAQDAIVKGLQTMFTWYPARDASPRDAYIRALPYLGQKLQDGKDNTIERGNSVWWQEWKDKRAEVDATALLVVGEHPADQPDTVERSVLVTQTVKTPDGQVLDTNPMLIESVVAKKNPQGWRVDSINFFKTNQFRTAGCPQGQSHQPTPDGPCAPTPPPPIQCPDGSTVPPDQTCPATGTGPGNPTVPSTKQCPDGSTVPANQSCPTTTTAGPQCPQGQTPDSSGTCQCPSGTEKNGDQCVQPCPQGQTRDSTGTCQCPSGTEKNGDQCVQPCPQGQTRDSTGTCQCPSGTVQGSDGSCTTPCPTGQTRDSYGTCQCPSGTVQGSDGSCTTPCPNGQVRSGGTCQCPSGTVMEGGSCVTPCPAGQVRSGGTCQCPSGTTLVNGSCVAPCIGRAYRDASGNCACPNGSTASAAEGCGSYVGAGEAPPQPRIEVMTRIQPAAPPPDPDSVNGRPPGDTPPSVSIFRTPML